MTKLTIEQIKWNLNKVPGWKLVEDQHALYRTFTYQDFQKAVLFINQISEYVDQDANHLDIHISGSIVTISLSTQNKGLTGKDFALAQMISKLAL
ncbi:4a-hydroxytetrahydrobiopterin dehydratase [Brevibacillus ginsengisoli]|uniref:4a-hydroxytetrahydrobiopterin dehydratase n=1 Tax=Brevibacillus ginsengisoli TaxID=363854 RepID=UPI003CEF0CC7